MTIKEASIQMRTALTAIYGEDEAIAIGNWVMEHLTGQKKTSWLDDSPFSAGQQSLFEKYKTELLSCKPVQYVLHEAWFFGLCLYVDESVLIPRPETEELVDWLVKDIRAENSSKAIRILDIGTGSGCIPLAIKSALPHIEMHSCDISEAALGVAEKNAKDLGLDIHFHRLDILNNSSWQQLPAFDFVISNPPYIPESDRPSMHSNVVDFEPAIALFVPDGDALVFYRAIAALASERLDKSGSIYLELHESMAQQAVQLYQKSGFTKIQVRTDLQGKERMLKLG